MGAVNSTVRMDEREPVSNSGDLLYSTVVKNSGLPVTYYQFPSRTWELPSQVDLRDSGCVPYPPILNQSALQHCSSAAVTAAFQCAQRHQQLTPFIEPSTMYNYYYARQLQGGNAQGFDSGTSVESALSAMQVGGVAEERMWPYEASQVNVTPTEAAQRNALGHSLVQYDRLAPTLSNLKQTLAHGLPFLFTFAITKGMDQWLRDRDAQLRTGFMILIDQFAKSQVMGAHTVLVVGYDDQYLRTGAFLCRNSWGSDWGQGGHFWFAYADIIYPDLSTSFFVVRQVCSSETDRCVNRSDCQEFYGDHICASPAVQE